MRKDAQHKEYHIHLLGLPVYFASSKEGSVYWRDMCHAFALVMREHDPELKRQRVGAGTGIILLTRLALKWLPEPFASETHDQYMILTAKRRASDEIDAQAAQDATSTPA